jgi:hypothetical protein
MWKGAIFTAVIIAGEFDALDRMAKDRLCCHVKMRVQPAILQRIMARSSEIQGIADLQTIVELNENVGNLVSFIFSQVLPQFVTFCIAVIFLLRESPFIIISMTLFFAMTLLRSSVTSPKFAEMSRVCDAANRQKDHLILDVVTNRELVASYDTHQAEVDEVAK